MLRWVAGNCVCWVNWVRWVDGVSGDELRVAGISGCGLRLSPRSPFL
jgi:hypothetical protein